MFVPIISVVAFIFDLQVYIEPELILLIGSAGLLIFVGLGILLLLLQRKQYDRRVKPSYHKEFSLVMFIAALGILGFGIIFTYLGGATRYIPHVVIPIFLGVYSVIFFLGKRYFNVDVIQ
jgi:hypothetical protein